MRRERGPEALDGEEAQEALVDAIEPTAFAGEQVAVNSLRSIPSTGFELELDYSIDLDEMEVVAHGELVQGGAPQARVETIVDGEDAWYRSSGSGFGRELEPGDEWIGGSVASLDDADAGTVTQPLEFTSHLHLLRGAREVEAGGTDVIGGAPVRLYEFEIDKSEALAAGPDEVRDQLAQSVLNIGPPATLDGKAALDGDGRVRRLEVALPPVVDPPGAPRRAIAHARVLGVR